MNPEWPPVSLAIDQHRHELVLSGPKIAELLDKHGFDRRIYTLKQLNFLDISHIGLKSVSEEIGDLVNLAQLCLSSNQLTSIPSYIGQLHALHFLDLSFNQIAELPPTLFANLSNLTILDMTGNMLTTVPSMQSLSALQELKVSKNQLKSFPDGLHTVTSLTLVDMSHNQLDSLPTELCALINLKTANFSDNQLKTLPTTLCQCRKLHALNLQNNPLKDNRLRKLTCDAHSQKSLFDYLRRLDDSAGKGKKGHGKGHTDSVSSPDTKTAESVEQKNQRGHQHTLPHIIIKRPDAYENFHITQTSGVKNGVRPYLVACSIHGVRFRSESHLKSFIQEQHNWHCDLGEMRRKATLATHDLRRVQFPLIYDLKKGEDVQIHVLNTASPTTGSDFLKQLYKEAEADRKTRKHSKFSQLHRYLEIFSMYPGNENQQFHDRNLPVLSDATGKVISLPPLTNCNDTRLTVETTEILLEVTGKSLDLCKQMAEAVIFWLLTKACPETRQPSGDGSVQTDPGKNDLDNQLIPPENGLIIRPIRVSESESTGNLCSMFPSRLDLVDPKFNTVR